MESIWSAETKITGISKAKRRYKNGCIDYRRRYFRNIDCIHA